MKKLTLILMLALAIPLAACAITPQQQARVDATLTPY
jgi:hypothetical protein